MNPVLVGITMIPEEPKQEIKKHAKDQKRGRHDQKRTRNEHNTRDTADFGRCVRQAVQRGRRVERMRINAADVRASI